MIQYIPTVKYKIQQYHESYYITNYKNQSIVFEITKYYKRSQNVVTKYYKMTRASHKLILGKNI